MALFDSVFLKHPSTLESVIGGACFMQSCLWRRLAGFSMSSNKVPSFWSPLVLQENNCFLEGHSKEKSRNSEVDFHPLYSHMYIYISSAKRSPNKVQCFPLQSSKRTREGLKVSRRDLVSLTWAPNLYLHFRHLMKWCC